MIRGIRGSWFRLAAILVVALFAAVSAAGVSAAGGHSHRARAAFAQQCPDPNPGTRDPSNPLMLKTPPGPNPLNGASFFVNGPKHGVAAGAIAQLLGLDPTAFPDGYSWDRFKTSLTSGVLQTKLLQDSALLHQVTELEKIAGTEEAQRFSAYSQGGSPRGVFNQAQKIFCGNLTADPGSIPVLTTYFLHPDARGCPTPGQLSAAGPTFRAQVDAMAAATERRPAVYLLELDAVGSSKCIKRAGALHIWESDLRYEAKKMASLPHTVVYLEAGYSDGNSPRYTAKVLNASGIRSVRGFFTNDTHLNWTSREIKWGEKVSKKTHGADFIVNTTQNGNGPQLNPHPSKQGIENLCNPAGRALGPQPTTDTGFAHVDAFLWTLTPALSSGSCGGGPKAGSFWVARAVQMAEAANNQLGPGSPSRPY
jgi:hypothetical protein